MIHSRIDKIRIVVSHAADGADHGVAKEKGRAGTPQQLAKPRR